ncbi:MAG: histidine kinase [Bacteroidales bacterium]|nr:histidine kinase [Bacteroidales bacterium]
MGNIRGTHIKRMNSVLFDFYKKHIKKHKVLTFIIKWQCLSVLTVVLFWLLWAIIDFNECMREGVSFKVVIFDYIYCTVFTLFVIQICKFILFIFSSRIKNRLVYLSISIIYIVVNVLLALLFEKITNLLFFNELESNVLVEGFYIFSLISTLLSILILSNHHYSLYIMELKERQKTELLILKQQLDPHFMFNNLGTLDALMESDTEMAHLYLNKLSRCYRYITDNINVDSIEIRDAVQFIDMYLDLLQTSMPGHIKVEIEKILRQSYDKIIPMSLQILVENAVKHNCHSTKVPLYIIIKKDGGYITVTNTYNPIKHSITTSKSGLCNLVKRYQYITGEKCIISSTETLFTVKIPIIKDSK